MKALEKLIARIVQRVNINLRELDVDVFPYIEKIGSLEQLGKFYAFYGITPNHPLHLEFLNSNLAGSYFLGRCSVDHSILYKSDIRGDELKKKGDRYPYNGTTIPVYSDETIQIRDSFLMKTLVHCFSHDPETLEDFFIDSTVSTHYANIHGAPVEGCFLEPFSTIDLTTAHDTVLGAFSYVQAGEIAHLKIDPGTVWVRSGSDFNFLYRYPREIIDRYIRFEAGSPPRGLLMDFVEERKEAFQRVFDVVNLEFTLPVPDSTSVDRYALIMPKSSFGENVLVAQRAYIENSVLGKGANAQENCYLINTRMEGFNVTAHGAKIMNVDLASNTFVGFNCFLIGKADARLTIGKGCIVMPHTIIDLKEPVTIPDEHLVWGYIQSPADLEKHSISLDKLSTVRDGMILGDLLFEGNGETFVHGFKHRIEHILESNGAFFDGTDKRGHAQKNQRISFNTVQPYPDGEMEGMYPTISIRP